MKIHVGFTIALIAVQVHATKIQFRDLASLVSDADHVLVGTVSKVDMIDEHGNQITDEKARTGPGIKNRLRLHVSVTTNGIILSTTNHVPDKIVINLWQKSHHTLGDRRKGTEGETFIFLLKGQDFRPVYSGFFLRKQSELADIEAILKRRKSQNN